MVSKLYNIRFDFFFIHLLPAKNVLWIIHLLHMYISFDSFGAIGLTCAVDQTSLAPNIPPDEVAAQFCCSHPVARETGCQNDVAGGSLCYAQCKFLPIPAALVPPPRHSMSAQSFGNPYYPPAAYVGNPYYNPPNYAGFNPYYPRPIAAYPPPVAYYPPPVLPSGPVINPTSSGWALDSCGYHKYS